MKHKRIILVLLLLIAAVFAAFLMQTSSATSLFYFENRTEDGVQASYLYLNEERTYNFEIDSKRYGYVEIDSKGGLCYVEIIDADGAYLVDTSSRGHSGHHFSSETDIVVHLTFVDHSGGFQIYFSDEPTA